MKNTSIVKAHHIKDGTISVVIPKSIREKAGIESGDYVLVTCDKNKRVVFKKIEQVV